MDNEPTIPSINLCASLEFISCKVCGNSAEKILASYGKYRYVRCEKCGLIYLNPRPSNADLDNLYRTQLSPADASADPTNKEELYLFRFSNNIKGIDKYKKTKGRILDVGSAWGHFLSVAREDGWDAYGIEPSHSLVNYSRERFGLNIVTGKLSDAKFPPGYFDVVTLWHVFEHIPHPEMELLQIGRLLKRDGLLVIEVPGAGRFRDDTVKDGFSRLHLFYYSASTLRSLLERTGFKIIALRNCGGTGILKKMEDSNLFHIRNFIVKNFRYFKMIKKLLQDLLAACNAQQNILVYAIPDDRSARKLLIPEKQGYGKEGAYPGKFQKSAGAEYPLQPIANIAFWQIYLFRKDAAINNEIKTKKIQHMHMINTALEKLCVIASNNPLNPRRMHIRKIKRTAPLLPRPIWDNL